MNSIFGLTLILFQVFITLSPISSRTSNALNEVRFNSGDSSLNASLPIVVAYGTPHQNNQDPLLKGIEYELMELVAAKEHLNLSDEHNHIKHYAQDMK